LIMERVYGMSSASTQGRLLGDAVTPETVAFRNGDGTLAGTAVSNRTAPADIRRGEPVAADRPGAVVSAAPLHPSSQVIRYG
jgi:hypothetical protein